MCLRNSMTPYSVGNHIQIFSLKQTYMHVYWYTAYLHVPFVLHVCTCTCIYLITCVCVCVCAHVSVYFSLTTSVVRGIVHADIAQSSVNGRV